MEQGSSSAPDVLLKKDPPGELALAAQQAGAACLVGQDEPGSGTSCLDGVVACCRQGRHGLESGRHFYEREKW